MMKPVITPLTIDDNSINEEYVKQKAENDERRKTWPKLVQQGPNINIKLPRRSFNSQEERVFFTQQITLKQKTEVIILI